MERLTGQCDATPPWLVEWARFASNLGFDDLPEAVVERTIQILYDSIGAIAAGAQEPEIQRLTARLTRPDWSGSGGTSPVIGGHLRSTAGVAALLNGIAGTALELDEGSQYARGHPGIHVVPSALAAAHRDRAQGRALIAAVALGYELAARAGHAAKMRPAVHAHGTWGTMGAALAVAKLSNASAAQLIEVVNMAASLGLATSNRSMTEGGTVRNAFAGWANQTGLAVWELAASGFCGEADATASVFGQVIGDGWASETMAEGLGTRWEITRNYFKMHACCRYVHGALDALDELEQQIGARLDPGSIERIEIETYSFAARLSEPAPRNTLAARFSVPFAVATRLVHGTSDIAAFSEAARTGVAVRALVERTTLLEDPAMTARQPRERPARVKLDLTDGRTLSAERSINKGDSTDPYSDDELAGKFLSIVSPIWPEPVAQRILAMTRAMPELTSLDDYCALLAS
ncbi:MAG: MmgE/PrpD family protein [Lautropia sp.]